MTASPRAYRYKTRLLDKQGGRCHWCDKPVVVLPGQVKKVPKNAATEDHVYPRGDARRQLFAHSPTVITKVIACRSCNQQRGSMPYDDFLKLKRPEWRTA